MFKLFGNLRLTEMDVQELAAVRNMLEKEISPKRTNDKANLLSVNKVTRSVERVTKKLVEYKAGQEMGKIRWLKLVNELRWTLHDAGYSDEFVALVSEAVIAKSVVVPKRAAG